MFADTLIDTFFDSVEDELAFQQQFRKGCGSCALNLDSLQVETRLILTFLGIGEVGWLGGWVVEFKMMKQGQNE